MVQAIDILRRLRLAAPAAPAPPSEAFDRRLTRLQAREAQREARITPFASPPSPEGDGPGAEDDGA